MEGQMIIGKPWRQLLKLVVAATFGVGLLQSTGAARADDAGFERWIASFRSTALQNGISGATFDRAFAGVTDPDPGVFGKEGKQAEFVAPAWDYFDNRIQEKSISTGREMARKWKSWLDR